MNFFAETLKLYLDEHGMNQAQLAEYLGIEPPYISRWLRGAYPRLDLMQDVLRRLGWNLDRARPDYDPIEDAIQWVRSGIEEGDPSEGHEWNGEGPGQARDLFLKSLHEFIEYRRRERDARPRVIGTVDPETQAVSLGPVLPRIEKAAHESLPLLCTSKSAKWDILTVGEVAPVSGYDAPDLMFVEALPAGTPLQGGSQVVARLGQDGVYLLRYLPVMDDEGMEIQWVMLTSDARPARYFQLGPDEVTVSHIVRGVWRGNGTLSR